MSMSEGQGANNPQNNHDFTLSQTVLSSRTATRHDSTHRSKHVQLNRASSPPYSPPNPPLHWLVYCQRMTLK